MHSLNVRPGSNGINGEHNAGAWTVTSSAAHSSAIASASAFARSGTVSAMMPSNATNEEFAAFLMVAKEYNLNPLLREIHAFPKKGGGIQPVISIDGWVSLINQNPQLDGYTFEWTNDAKGDPISCKCIMLRKDRKHPVVVEEFLSECIRPTEPWKMKHRMLRHKALIQAARYAFGLSGIMDADEAEAIAGRVAATVPGTDRRHQRGTIEALVPIAVRSGPRRKLAAIQLLNLNHFNRRSTVIVDQIGIKKGR